MSKRHRCKNHSVILYIIQRERIFYGCFDLFPHILLKNILSKKEVSLVWKNRKKFDAFAIFFMKRSTDPGERPLTTYRRAIREMKITRDVLTFPIEKSTTFAKKPLM